MNTSRVGLMTCLLAFAMLGHGCATPRSEAEIRDSATTSVDGPAGGSGGVGPIGTDAGGGVHRDGPSGGDAPVVGGLDAPVVVGLDGPALPDAPVVVDGQVIATCGNGVIESGEQCDPVATCPTACPAQGCQLRKLVNGGTCAATCIADQQQTVCLSGDGCCPSGCNNTNDTDCSAKCGNGTIEGAETCDPVSLCNSQRAACTSNKETLRTPTGEVTTCTFKCMETPRPCGPADGQCPSGCGPGPDPDCRKPNGESCGGPNDCTSGNCAAGVCCNSACSGVCQSCKLAGSLGTCQKTCECRVQSPENLVPNGGFDNGALDWDPHSGDPGADGTLTHPAKWSDESDETGCPSSGAILTQGYVQRCFLVPAATVLNFGVSVNTTTAATSSGAAEMRLDFYSNSDCTAHSSEISGAAAVLSATGPAGWQRKSIEVRSPSDAVAANVSAHCFSVPTLFDNFYLSKAPTKF